MYDVFTAPKGFLSLLETVARRAPELASAAVYLLIISLVKYSLRVPLTVVEIQSIDAWSRLQTRPHECEAAIAGSFEVRDVSKVY
jgi:hypothetical protein